MDVVTHVYKPTSTCDLEAEREGSGVKVLLIIKFRTRRKKMLRA